MPSALFLNLDNFKMFRLPLSESLRVLGVEVHKSLYIARFYFSVLTQNNIEEKKEIRLKKKA